MYDRGIGSKAIAVTLNREGYRTNQAHVWGQVYPPGLRNRAYIGILDYNLPQTRGQREPIVIPGFYPPILDQALFDRVQEQLKQRGDNWQNSYSHRTSYLLSDSWSAIVVAIIILEPRPSQDGTITTPCRTYLQKGRRLAMLRC